MNMPATFATIFPKLPSLLIGSAAILAAPFATPAIAETYKGIEFPQGESSFADRVVTLDYNSATGVTGEYLDGNRALGAPDDESMSLGNASDLNSSSVFIVEFVDNRLVDAPGADLYIFEVGPSVQSTNVAISIDGQNWYDLGRIKGSTRAIDLADFSNLPAGAQYRFVRLRDYPDGRTSGRPYGGPDIDAIGAIGSIAAPPDNQGNGQLGQPPAMNDQASACSNGNITFQAIGNPQVSVRFEPANNFVSVPYTAIITHNSRGEIARFDYSVSVGYPTVSLVLQNSATPQEPPSFTTYFFDSQLMPTYGDLQSEYVTIAGFGSYDHYFNSERGSRTAEGAIGDVMWRNQCSG